MGAILNTSPSFSISGIKSLSIWANTSPCAHLCRFCQIGDRGPKRFELARWMQQVQRFREWQAASGHDLVIDHGWPGPAYDFHFDDYVALEDWLGERFTVIPLGGVAMRSRDDMHEWLRLRRDRGLNRIHGAFVGSSAVHDAWVGRRGDFAYLLDTFRSALDLGMTYSVTLYLTKSTLPHLDKQAELFDAMPHRPEYRHVRHFYYGGYAAEAETERLEAEDLERVPHWALEALREHFDLQTEAVWLDRGIEAMRSPMDVHLSLELRRDNIAIIERQSCAELVAHLSREARQGFASLPPMDALAREVADRSSSRLYGEFEVSRLWLDRYLATHTTAVNRLLLHEHIGRRDSAPRIIL